jgi:DNA-directed RNA polymerase subunit delta
MGGFQVGDQHRPMDDGYDEDGYDESQRAEILEATRDGPTDGAIMTDLPPDLGDDEDDELTMLDSELGEEDDEAELTEEAESEDEIQAGFDDEDEDEELDDADEDALEP